MSDSYVSYALIHFIGLVSDCPLLNYDSSSCEPTSTDNDGLWTSWAVVSEALRYQVTHDEEARSNAWSLYKGLKFLVEVTGVPGLPARSVIQVGNDSVNISSISDEFMWHKSVTNPYWYWKGDTSSDEVSSHFCSFTLSVCTIHADINLLACLHCN